MKTGSKWANTERRFVTEPVSEDEPKNCSYCGRPTSDFHFTAFSLDGKSSICCDCLETFAIISRLGRLRKAYGNGKSWEKIAEDISTEVRAEPSTNAMRKVASDLCLGISRRACSILCGFREVGNVKDPHTGVDLAPPRVALTGQMAREMGALVKRGCELFGAPVVQATVSECRSGAVHEMVRHATMRDPLVNEHAVIFVKDGYVRLDVKNPVVYAVTESAVIPDSVKALSLE